MIQSITTLMTRLPFSLYLSGQQIFYHHCAHGWRLDVCLRCYFCKKRNGKTLPNHTLNINGWMLRKFVELLSLLPFISWTILIATINNYLMENQEGRHFRHYCSSARVTIRHKSQMDSLWNVQTMGQSQILFQNLS